MDRIGHLISAILLLSSASLFIPGCGTQKKVKELGEGSISPSLSMSKHYEADLPELRIDKHDRDTLVVEDLQGRKYHLMEAIKDENGEMVANEVINAAVVSARFRNIAERHGKVDIRFEVAVPQEMTDSKWQLRFNPRMEMLGESIDLDPVIITGKGFRARQLKGYERYRKFLDSIVSDTSKFINMRDLEIFIKRNIPDLYELKTDSTFISDERFESIYGVTAKEALDHYTNGFLVRRNNRRIASKDRMYRKYVKTPIETESIKLDTVITGEGGEFIYEYIQTISTRARLKKVDVILSGEIFDEDKKIYTIPESEPLSYYISSLSTLLDPQERYLTKVVSRQAEANTVCMIGFETGKHEIDPGRGNNREELERITGILEELMEDREYDLDSISVTASCSPEGSFRENTRLAAERAKAVSGYFSKYRKHGIRFLSACVPENWELLANMAAGDGDLSDADKEDFLKVLEIRDPDKRETTLQGKPYYSHLSEKIYPELRRVEFLFHMHRKGMIKDTIHTTVLDTTYMRGLKALQERDYETAVSLLRPYADYNAAVAFCALDRNASAMTILEALKPDDKVEYLMAILSSRKGDDKAALQHYLNAVALNRSYIHRGNLDPEISVLIKKYGLENE